MANAQSQQPQATVTMTYDKVDRMRTRIEAEGTTSWTYGTQAPAIGKLTRVTAPTRGLAGSVGYLREHTYDALGRPSSTITTIDGASFTVQQAYDTRSNPTTTTYPSGFAVTDVYTSIGYLQKVVNAIDQTPYWTANTMDAQGQITQESLGNGLQTLRSFNPAKGFPTAISTGPGTSASVQKLTYTWDAAARLQSQTDGNQSNVSETFTYDSLNRLYQATVSGQGTRTYLYDLTGNLTSKSDFGSYAYGANGAGPHQVTSTSGVGGNWTYAYDGNGNMLSGLGRTISYTSFNQTMTLGMGSVQEDFDYGPEHDQIVRKENSEITLYVGTLFERVVTAAGATIDKDYIFANGALIAVHQPTAPAPQAPFQYFHKDYRRSVETVTDGNGTVIEHISYDPWGKKRYTNWTDPTPTQPLVSSSTNKGFTGQEHIDKAGVVNMGARLYDPSLARFLSPDSTVQAPLNPQTLNRYSYAGNNPMSYDDPSGHSFLSVLRIVAAIVVVAAIAWWAPEFAAWAAPGLLGTAATATTAATLTWSGAIATGIVGGAAGGAIAGGGQGALLGALGGALFAGFGSLAESYNLGEGTWGTFSEKVLGHAAIGGSMEEVRGGKFVQGFLSGGFAEAASPGINEIGEGDHGFGAICARSAAAAVVGGTAAVIGGGKFENGAMTGAFSQLLNNEVHYATHNDKNAFFDRVRSGAGSVAEHFNVDEDYVMGLAAYESGWNTNEAAIAANNPLGINKPGSTTLRTFASVDAAFDYWGRHFGAAVEGTSTIPAFVDALHHLPAGAYNSVNPKYDPQLSGTIRSVEIAKTQWILDRGY